MSFRIVQSPRRPKLAHLGFVLLIAAGSASASVVGIYTGFDNGAGPGGSYPGSTAAQSNFWTAIGASAPTITFEGVSSLSNLGSGVSASITNGDYSQLQPLQNVDRPNLMDQTSTEPTGFNVTSGGSEWLMFIPPFNSATGETITFTFSNPIRAFGAWFTDTQTDLPGPLTITFNDGAPEMLTVTKNGLVSGQSLGGTVYYGFTTDTPFSSLTIHTGPTGGSRDTFGLDNITLVSTIDPSPEPSTFSLIACAALFALAARKLRGRIFSAVPRRLRD